MESILRDIVQRYIKESGSVVSILQDTQDRFGYIPHEAISYFSNELNIPESRFFGVATFYSQFYLKPRGKNIITACCGTACHVRGVDKTVSAVKRALELRPDEDTTDDNQFTLEKVACLGFCSIAPVVLVNGEVFGKAAAEKIVRKINSIRKSEDEE
ncbi:MAG: NAD(P)H-dependent oxidoreductase subunit E [Nitrospiraceae bacterium]|nr:NAD(P)H-dependent oxidoreductase subunit E [Nitrospiraceae bacterium]